MTRTEKKFDLESVGTLLELDFEFHHGGGLAGADDGGEGHDGGYGLGEIRLLPPEVELVDDAEGPAAAADGTGPGSAGG